MFETKQNNKPIENYNDTHMFIKNKYQAHILHKKYVLQNSISRRSN